MAFSKSLKTLRNARSLTQDQLASLTGISKSAISMYENGKRFPDENTLKLLSNFFQVDMNSLLGNNGNTVAGIVDISDRPYLTTREVALLEAFHRLNEDGKDKLFDYAYDLIEMQKYTRSKS